MSGSMVLVFFFEKWVECQPYRNRLFLQLTSSRKWSIFLLVSCLGWYCVKYRKRAFCEGLFPRVCLQSSYCVEIRSRVLLSPLVEEISDYIVDFWHPLLVFSSFPFVQVPPFYITTFFSRSVQVYLLKRYLLVSLTVK